MIDAYSSVGASAKGARLIRMQASPNYQEDRFVNPTPAKKPSFVKVLIERIKGNEHTTPTELVPVIKPAKSDFMTQPDSGLRVTWLGHSTSLVEIDGKRLLLDPVFSQRVSPFSFIGPKRFFAPPLSLEDLPPIDAVLISHDHFDHLDKTAIQRLAATPALFIVPLGIGAHLEDWGVPAERIIELDWWQSTQLGNISIHATPARHFSGRSLFMTDRDAKLWAGFAMLGPKHRVYYSGDTGMFKGFEEIGRKLGPFDVSLIEVGAYNRLWADMHLGPEQAVQALRQVRGGVMIPMHWGTFDLAMHSWTEPVERVLRAAQDTGVVVAVPRPGQSVEPSRQLPTARWWPDLPWQTSGEHPVVSSGLQLDRGVTTRALQRSGQQTYRPTGSGLN